MTDVARNYTGWLPRALRRGYPESRKSGGSGAGPQGRAAKRSRLSKTKLERNIYCSAHGHRVHPDLFQRLTEKAHRINGFRPSEVNTE